MDLIQPALAKAFERTMLILFKPFKLKKWIALTFIAFLAGAIISGGGTGGNFGNLGGNPGNRSQNQYQKEGLNEENNLPASRTPAGSQNQSQNTTYPPKSSQNTADPSDTKPSDNPKDFFSIFLLVTAVTIPLILAIIIVFMWLNGRFRFIFYQAIVDNQSSIKENWRKYKTLGNSFFKFNLLLFVLNLAILLVLGLITLLGLYALDVFSSGMSLAAGLFIFLMVLVYIAAMVFYSIIVHLIEQFCTPIMVKDNITIRPAIGTLRGLFRENKRPFLFYILAAIVLGLILSVASSILSLIILIPILLLTIPLGMGIYFLAGSGAILVISIILLVIPTILVTTFLSMMAGLPAAVFFRSFSLYYLASICPRYDAFSPPELPSQVG